MKRLEPTSPLEAELEPDFARRRRADQRTDQRVDGERSSHVSVPTLADPLPLRQLLREELALRCKRNPKYSLRSFAMSLKLSPAFVSKLMHGQRPFTERTLEILAERIPLNPAQVAFYRTQVGKRPKEISLAGNFRTLGLDAFQSISDWYHFAILELTTVQDFDPSPKAIAKRLGISVHEADVAIERLLRLGRLQRSGSAALKLTDEHNTTIGPEISVPATRNQQTQILELALHHLQETPIELRSQTSMTMAMPAARVQEAKALIFEFRRRLTELMQRPEEGVARDSVYQLAISFFPLTTKLTASESNPEPETKSNIEEGE